MSPTEPLEPIPGDIPLEYSEPFEHPDVIPDASDIPLEEMKSQSAKRIAELESELELIKKGREAAERILRQERERARRLAKDGTLSVQRNWISLANEMAALKGTSVDEKGEYYEEIFEANVIDFTNRLRFGALDELEADTDEILVIKAKAYEIWFKCCTSVLAGRNLKLKISQRDAFEATKIAEKSDKAKKTREKAVKAEASRRRTPEEMIMDQLKIATGGNEELAKQMYEQMMNAGKKK